MGIFNKKTEEEKPGTANFVVSSGVGFVKDHNDLADLTTELEDAEKFVEFGANQIVTTLKGLKIEAKAESYEDALARITAPTEEETTKEKTVKEVAVEIMEDVERIKERDWVRSQTVSVNPVICGSFMKPGDVYLERDFDSHRAIQLFMDANPEKNPTPELVHAWLTEQMPD